MFDKVDNETGNSMMSAIFDGVDFFKEATLLMDAAQSRLLVAASAFVPREEAKN